jgi:oxygen-independent coproporphyrinogen-3 oxidase
MGCTLTSQERKVYRRYAELALPRHTSYPIAPVWKSPYSADTFRADLERSGGGGRDLSVYVHIPFCQRLCYYCACTKEIVPPDKRRQTDPAESLLEGLEAESARFAELVRQRPVEQLHLGGGSPTFLTVAQLQRFWQILTSHFELSSTAEVAIEIDPRITSREQLEVLRGLGFNRVSLGIQDFDPEVQRVVNRLQPLEMVEQAVDWCRQLGFNSINFDLIYGLPRQTVNSLAQTIRKTISLQPDRIAFYRLAVIPEIFRWQNVFRPSDLPASDLCLELNLLAINEFTAAGYEFIGLDHFARPTEALAAARDSQSLQRNFQGVTTGKGLDLLGLGPSAISLLDDAYAQNVKTTETWRQAVSKNLAKERGLRLDADDRLRRELLQQLYGYGAINKRSLETAFDIDFEPYFAGEIDRLESLVDDGLVTVDTDAIRLTNPLGRLLVRVVAAVFDRYLPKDAWYNGLPAQMASKVG